MELADITTQFMTPARAKAMRAALKQPRATVYGLAGSSVALLLATMPRPSRPVLVVGDSPDDAGYLYYDLARLCGEDAVAMLPSGYKRDIKYGQPDEPNRILRVEALQRVAAADGLRFVVSYPEALAERVASADALDAHTLGLRVGATVDLTATEQWLLDNGFRMADYVYEPGQFAVRGSILDIYAYNNELPFRIDFFGDEIDSIREFNVETQLSERKMDAATITANVSAGSDGGSLLEFMGPDTLVAMRSITGLPERVRAVAALTPAQATIITGEGEQDALRNVVDAERFVAALERMPQLLLSPSAEVPPATKTAVNFECSPQAVYHKNFDLIAESFEQFRADGYQRYILSDNAHQFDRLRSIFADRGDDINFTAVEGTLHEGFVDHARRMCVFTDHQIFDRFHKFTLRSDRARSGRMALSLKELGQ
ncbi:MAG: transcription-repair coupling factor, partial [Muribaculaceae bacterium]|nr:transcription-repair coupling factor [Muribaculaceae bacterium]